LPLLVSLDWVLSKPVTGFVDKLIIALCVLMFLEPVALICIGGHYWWNGRIYWMFPVICLFIVGSAVELYLNKIAIQQVV